MSWHTERITLDEIGRHGNLSVDVDVEFIVQPGEEAIPYFDDGSGFPGSPDEVEIECCTVLTVDSELYSAVRADHPRLFAALDDYVLRFINEDALLERTL